MRQCLTNPDGGYYTKALNSSDEADPFGVAGDFVTSPEISQIFGELVGIWFMTEWMAQGRASQGVHLIEMGPGRGTLMSDILRTIGQFKTFSNAISAVWLVEAGEGLRKRQKDLLCGEKVEMKRRQDDSGKNIWWEATSSQGIPVRWVEDVALLPQRSEAEHTSFIIAHEFFDALPIHAFESVAPRPKDQSQEAKAQIMTEAELRRSRSSTRKSPQWRELLVAPTTPKLASLLQPETPLSKEPDPEFQLTLAKASTPSSLVIPNGPRYQSLKNQPSSRVEISPESTRYIMDFATRIGGPSPPATQSRLTASSKAAKGAALIIDYGPASTIPSNSLRAIRKHKVVSPFTYAGGADISADVDFVALADAALEASPNVEVHGPVEQGIWLLQLGIKERAERLLKELERRSGHDSSEELAKRKTELESGWKRLVEGGVKGMGKAYKVMAIVPENGGRRRPVGFGGDIPG
jgi:NADH dehydrogenase [ubiquinone] 1 alpha subcomplex assembly factor 7